MLLHLLLAQVSILMGAAPHSVSIAWADAVNTGATYAVYRALGTCAGSPTFASIASGIAAKGYSDRPIAVGSYCYQVTATVNSVESTPTASVSITVPAGY